jgi:hypothetical protein
MRSIRYLLIAVLLMTGLVLVGCSTPATEAPAEEAGGVTFSITGAVDNEMSWSESQIRAMDTMEAESTNNSGETETYTGVSMNALLDMAGPADSATTLVLVGDDGYEVEVDLAEVRACSDCIVQFRNNGGFSSLLPGQPGNTRVKGIIEMRVQ